MADDQTNNPVKRGRRQFLRNAAAAGLVGSAMVRDERVVRRTVARLEFLTLQSGVEGGGLVVRNDRGCAGTKPAWCRGGRIPTGKEAFRKTGPDVCCRRSLKWSSCFCSLTMVSVDQL
jgi:hypothetical protein